MTRLEKQRAHAQQWRAILGRLLMGIQTIPREEFCTQWELGLTWLRCNLRDDALPAFETAVMMVKFSPCRGYPFSPEEEAIKFETRMKTEVEGKP